MGATTVQGREAQIFTALGLANEARLRQAQFKRDLAEHKVSAAEALNDPPEWLRKVPLSRFLQWLPGIKKSRARKIMLGIVFSETLTVGALSEATRGRILERIERYQPTPYGSLMELEHAA